MRQLKFSLEDIKARPIAFILIFLQIMFCLIMISYSVSVINNTFDYKDKFSVFEKTSEMYMIVDNTDDEHITELWDDESSVNKLMEFYTYISNNKEFNSYCFVSDSTSFDTEKDLDTYSDKMEDGTTFYDLLGIDSNFSQVFNLKNSSGEFFSTDDYETDDNSIPVLLGSNYQKYYSIGDEIFENHIVKGFLEEKSFYLDPKSSGDVIYLDNYIITPLIINSDSDFPTLDNAITSTVILTDNQQDLQEISKKSQELDLYNFSFKSYTQQFNDIIASALTYIYLTLTIVFLVLFFCIICVISSLLNFLETHKKEFAVHLLCGARKRDFVLRIIWQIAIVIFLSNVVNFIIYGFSLASFSALLISIIILAIIVALPLIKIKNQSVNELLKRSE